MQTVRRFGYRLLLLVTAVALATGVTAVPAFADSPTRYVSCEAGEWRQVHAMAFHGGTYRYEVPNGGWVDWRWFAATLPPFWAGRFIYSADIWTPPSFYTSLEFHCERSSVVAITWLDDQAPRGHAGYEGG